MPGPRHLAGLLVAVAAFGGCGDGGRGDAPSTATGRFGALHTEVCAAADQAADGDTEAAQRTFADVHVGLHDLAAAVQEDDRALAARLLEAKQQVESGLSADTLEHLSGPVAAAVEATGGTAPASCP